MEYGALTLGMADELLCHLQTTLAEYSLSFSPVSTVQEASRQLSKKVFHLIIVDLDYLRDIGHTGWLESIRHISFVPLVILSDTPEEDMGGMVKLGADICVSNKQPYSTVADVAFAQLRRYTEYNHHMDLRGIEAAPFQKGDIAIDPSRHIVKVRGQPVNLRKREFSLLLYFMQHPNAVLTADQICENAWGMDYTQPVGKSVHELRRLIESNPSRPCYIHTIYRVGYRFTPYFSETCER